jgi:hypothetical protein
VNLNFFVISDGNLKSIEKTVSSIFKSLDNRKYSFNIIVQPASNSEAIADFFPQQNVFINLEKDYGIYDGMNKLIATIDRSNLKGLVCFLNGGDQLQSLDDVNFLNNHKVFYSDVKVETGGCISSYLLPYFLKMPHHQSMFIPVSFFQQTAYKYPPQLNIAGDLHLKMSLWSSGFQFSKIDKPLALVEDGGISTRFRKEDIKYRAEEMMFIAREFFGITYGYILFTVYFAWYSFRMLRER